MSSSSPHRRFYRPGNQVVIAKVQAGQKLSIPVDAYNAFVDTAVADGATHRAIIQYVRQF